MAGTEDESSEPMPEEVKTGADRLLDLVKRSKEIAMSAAANELGASVQTVEAWANFLEEDDLVTVKYKFTTPYIAVPDSPKAGRQHVQEPGSPADGVEFSQLKNELVGMHETLSKTLEEKAAGEFSLLKQTYSGLLSRLKLVHDKLVVQADIAPQKKVELNDLLKSLDGQLQEAAGHASEGRFDAASSAYSKLYEQASTAINELNKLYDQVMTLQSIHATKDYKDLLGKAYELMQGGKIEEANDLYEKLKFAHQNLAKEFIEKKKQMEEDLVKLNKDLATNVDQLNLEKLKRSGERIAVLLNAGNGLLRKGEFDTAESYYLAIKHEYETLPHGFINEKKDLQEKVLAFYSALAKQREKAIQQKFGRTVKQIEALISQIQELLKDYKVGPAVEAYRQVKQLYISLPPGFLEEKSALQGKIVPLHTAITSIYTKESLSTLKAKSSEIAALVAAMSAHTDRGELGEAEAAYERLKQLYRKMPKGFLHEETTLQEQIVQAYEAYLKKAKQMETSSSSSMISIMTKLIEKAEAAARRKEFESANVAYSRIMALYNTLPPGFALQKAGVRERVLHLYKTLLSTGSSAQLHQPESTVVIPAVRRNISELTPAYASRKEETIPLYEKEITPAPLHQTVEVPAIQPNGHKEKDAITIDTPLAEEAGNAFPDPQEVQGGNATAAGTAKEPGEASEATEYNDKDIEGIDREIDDIEKKIEDLKSLGKASVKFPGQES